MFARKGADIISFDLKKSEELKQYVEEKGKKCLLIEGNLTVTEDIQNAVDKAIEEFGKIDVLVLELDSWKWHQKVLKKCGI